MNACVKMDILYLENKAEETAIILEYRRVQMELTAILPFDAKLLYMIESTFKSNIMDHVMLFFTRMGDFGLVWIAAGLMLAFTSKYRRAGACLLMALAAGAIVGNLVMKPLIARPRPFMELEGIKNILGISFSYSFPSGHTTSSFAAAYMLTRYFGKKGALAYIPATLIAFSRMYFFVHYPSDIIGGIVTGTLCAHMVHEVSKKITKMSFPLQNG